MLANDTVKLQAFTLPRRGFARIDVNPAKAKELQLPRTIRIIAHPNVLALAFIGVPSAWGQAIARRRLTHRYVVQCPACGTWRRVLYLPPNCHRFVCRQCAGVTKWKRMPEGPPELALLTATGEKELAAMLEISNLSDEVLKQLKTCLRKGDTAGFEEGVYELVALSIALVGVAASRGDAAGLRVRERLRELLYPGG